MSDFQIQVIQTVIFLLGLMGVAFAGWQLFSWIKWNRIEIVLTLDGRWEGEPLVSLRKKLARKIDDIKRHLQQQELAAMVIEEKIPEELHTYLAGLKQNNLDEYLDYMAVPNFFETVGALAHRPDAYKLWGGAIVHYQKWFLRHIKARREDEKAPEMYQQFLELGRWCEKKLKVGSNRAQ